jgi:hypothetical protein
MVVLDRNNAGNDCSVRRAAAQDRAVHGEAEQRGEMGEKARGRGYGGWVLDWGGLDGLMKREGVSEARVRLTR